MLAFRLLILVSLLPAALTWADDASRLYIEGKKAEKKDEFALAYLLYSRAAAMDPRNTRYWLKSQALRSRAAMQAKVVPPKTPAADADLDPDREALDEATEAELKEARRPLPPKELKASAALGDFRLRLDARALFEHIAKVYGVDCVFDGDYPLGGTPYRFEIEQADYREALRAAQALTGSFVFPLGERLFMVAKDTQQKRNELEPAVAVEVPIPEPVTVQEAQEVARSVQQVMEIRRFAVDSQRRVVVMSGPLSKILPAQRVFQDLLSYRTEVAIEVKFVEVNRSDTLRLGLDLPNTFKIANGRAQVELLKKLVGRTITFGGGLTMFGFNIADAQLIASFTRSNASTLMHSIVRSSDGAAAMFHVGDRYPILTGGYFGGVDTSNPNAYRPPPQFQFEDLGITLKITPKVHGAEEVSLTVEAEFKVLSGSSLNDIPVIASRKLASQLRLKVNEWGVMTGLMSVSDARSVSGLVGLSQVPGLGYLLRNNTRTSERKDVLLLLKPRVVSMPPDQVVTRTIWTGPEGRLNVPL
jgi:general secretion pathway protein D